MDCNFKLLIICIVFASGLLQVKNLHGQQESDYFVFDEVLTRGLNSLNSNPDVSKQCLAILERKHEHFSLVQKAKTSFLRLQVIYSDPVQVAALEKRMFDAPDSLSHSDALICKARKYLVKSMPDKAIPLLMEAIDSLKTNAVLTHFCMINLCEAYRQKQEYAKGIEMLKDLLIQGKTISAENRAFAFNRLAALYNEWGNPKASYRDSVIRYSELGIALSEKIGSKSNLGFSLNELSFQYNLKQQFERALELSARAISSFMDEGMNFSAMNALINQSNIYLGLKQTEPAIQAIARATALCPIEENRNLFMRLYIQLSNINKLTGNFKDAYDFLDISYRLQTEFFKDRINIQINEQSARFDLLMKEQKIREEKQINEFHRKQILFLILTLVILAVVFILSIFYFRLKRKEFMKQKLIEAVIETESGERKRIARDLHDGLGPVLSAINHYFQAYIDANETDKLSIQARLQQVISGAIDEVSRISHNISPFVLEKHGLHTALNNFILPLKTGKKLRVEYTSDFTGRFELNKELTIYRCITELFSNTLKHAGATYVTLSVTHRDKSLYVAYTDNGKGFDMTRGKQDGMGLYNIRNRIETFGGRIMLESTPGRGIKVNMELPL